MLTPDSVRTASFRNAVPDLLNSLFVSLCTGDDDAVSACEQAETVATSNVSGATDMRHIDTAVRIAVSIFRFTTEV